MNQSYSEFRPFGTEFEQKFIGIISIITGLVLIYLAVEGPLFLHHLRYRTPDVINNQLVAQDLVNMVVLSPLLIIGGILVLAGKTAGKLLLIMTPLFLIYYALSYTIGWEWGSTALAGNNAAYTFYFLFVLVSALLILMYSLSVFPKKVEYRFNGKRLAFYSIVFCLFLIIFAGMWIKEIIDVISTGTTRGYDIAPTAFWLVRTFDLGFSIPLGLLSVYLLHVRPAASAHIQFLFYGFFLTMIVAVNAMGFMMFLNNDPAFMLRDLVVFLCLALIIAGGFVYILRNYSFSD